MLSLPQILLSITVIFCKDNLDMISEISKLDNLVVVSIFQESKFKTEDTNDSPNNSITSVDQK